MRFCSIRLKPSVPAVGGAGRGFAMIEFLVALLIFTTVSSALAATQLAGKRIGTEALYRTQASVLASDILQSIEANSALWANYLVDSAGNPAAPLPAPATDCARAQCEPAELAEFELWRWEQRLLGNFELSRSNPVGGLPKARGCISAVNGTVTVAISWRGLVSATQSTLSDCAAEAGGLYDATGSAEGNNLRRRQVVLSRYLSGAA